MQFNPNPKIGDPVRARIDGVIVNAIYLEPCIFGTKKHWVFYGNFQHYIPCGNDRFIYPIEQMENYKAKSNDTKTAV